MESGDHLAHRRKVASVLGIAYVALNLGALALWAYEAVCTERQQPVYTQQIDQNATNDRTENDRQSSDFLWMLLLN